MMRRGIVVVLGIGCSLVCVAKPPSNLSDPKLQAHATIAQLNWLEFSVRFKKKPDLDLENRYTSSKWKGALPAMQIGNTLRNIGVTILVVSVAADVGDMIVISRHLSEPRWVFVFSRIGTYLLWAGLLLVLADIVVRDRRWKR